MSSESRRVVYRTGPAREYVKDRQNHPVMVSHPTMTGDEQRFRASIESIFFRTEDDDRRLAFRGKASTAGWEGYKTFFADECRDLVDETTGQHIQDVAAWLMTIDDPIDPMTVIGLINSVSENLERDLGVKIGGASIVVGNGWSAIEYTSIQAPDDDPVDRLFFLLQDIELTDAQQQLGTDPIAIVVRDGPEESEPVEIEPGVTQIIRRYPIAELECIPCAGGRIEVRKARHQ